MRLALLAAALAAAAPALAAETLVLAPQTVPEWKAVYGRVEARDLVPARARIGGTVVELLVSEGDEVEAGQRIAVVRDDKIAFQIAAYDAQLRALAAQLEKAEAELARGSSLVERGVITAQRLEQLRTDVEVTQNQIAATGAQRSVVVQQGEEGEVLAPASGRVLTVPVTRGAVVMAGEPAATIGGGGFFLRLAIPERHSRDLAEGAAIRIAAAGAQTEGRLAKIIRRSRTAASSPMSRSTGSTMPSSTPASRSRCRSAAARRFWCRARRSPPAPASTSCASSPAARRSSVRWCRARP